MELRHLRYFCTVAEERHVTRAAERLRLAQPALTQQIRALETELRVSLLRRVGRGIELTEAGIAFWREAQAILERVRAATLIAQETARGLAGRLVIGLTETASFASDVTAVLKEARERWPQVQFGLLQARTSDLVAALTERRIDVAFVRSPVPGDDTLVAQPFLTEGLTVALPDTHPLAAERVIDIGKLSGQPLVIPRGRRTAGLWEDIAAAFSKSGHVMHIAQETSEFVVAINLVAAGVGVALVPTVLAGLRRDGVVYRPLRSDPPLKTDIIIVTRTGPQSPIVQNFLALASELTPRSRRARPDKTA